MVPISNNDSAGRWKDLNQGRFRKRAPLLQRRANARNVSFFTLYGACWYFTNNVKNATLFYQERKPDFHKNPEGREDNHSTTIHSYPVIQARIFVYLLM